LGSSKDFVTLPLFPNAQSSDKVKKGSVFLNGIIVVYFYNLITVSHEMDAIRTKEWRMLIILKDIADETAYKIFTLAHLPLYFIVFI